MAVIKAQASGNWSSTATWSGGVVPSLQDTVYANGYNITIDQSIDLTGSTEDTAGSFIVGQIYIITSVGTTTWTSTTHCIVPGTNAGTAVAITNAVGQIFQAVTTGPTGNGKARRLGALLNYVNTPLSIVTGGGFTISSNYNVTGAYIQAGSANCLTISGTASSTLSNGYAIGSSFNQSVRGVLISSSGTITYSNMYVAGGRVVGTTNANGTHGIEGTSSSGTIAFTNGSQINATPTAAGFCNGILNSSTQSLTFNGGSITGSIGGVNSVGGVVNDGAGQITCSNGTVITGGYNGTNHGILNNNLGSIIIQNCTITGGGSTGQNCDAIRNAGNGNITITGTTITGGVGTTSNGIYNAGVGSLTISSNSSITGGNSIASYGVQNNSTGTVSISADITASIGPGFYGANSGAITTLCGSQTCSVVGVQAVVCTKYLINPTPTTARIRHAKSGSGTYSDFYTSDNTFDNPNVSDVRLGVVYANNTLTGTCAVPAAGSVALGVPVDNTIGTAILTPSGVWNTLTNTLTTSNSIGERLKNVSTISSTGSQLAALTL